jgi:outer membrane murein-binding lipoprotein Lpp
VKKTAKFRTLLSLVLASMLIAGCSSGEGIHASLDVSTGYGVDYQASLAKAWEKMSSVQRDAFNALISNLGAGDVIARYGKSPTPASIVNGEIERDMKSLQAQQKDVQKRIDEMRDRIAAREAQRAKAISTLKAISGTAEFVTGATLTAHWATLCKNSCSGWGALNAFTTTSVPDGAQIKTIDCKGEYTYDGKSYPMEFYCSSGRAFNGDRYPKIPVAELAGKKITLTYDLYSAKDSNGDLLVPPQYEEVNELASIEQSIALLKTYQESYR